MGNVYKALANSPVVLLARMLTTLRVRIERLATRPLSRNDTLEQPAAPG